MSRQARVSMSEKPEAHFTEDTHHHDGHESLAPTGTRGTDNEKGSSRYASSDAGLAHKKGVSVAERKLLLKMGTPFLFYLQNIGTRWGVCCED